MDDVRSTVSSLRRGERPTAEKNITVVSCGDDGTTNAYTVKYLTLNVNNSTVILTII